MRYFLLLLIMMSTSFFSTAQISAASLTASGLTCSMCSKSIFKALEKVPSVESVDVDINQSVFKIRFKKDAAVLPDDIRDAVTDAGFGVASLQLTANFPRIEVGKDAHIRFSGATYHFLNVPSQTIEGEKTFTVVDKNYVSITAFRQFKKLTKMKCYETGKAEGCCEKDIPVGTRIYHITL